MELPARAQRRRVLKGAQIVFNGGHSTIDCVVRNLSATGALLRVESSLEMPEEFTLHIEGGERHSCEVVRRKLNELGVAFIG